MVDTASRMVKLWTSHRKQIVKTKPKFPRGLLDDSLAGFIKFARSNIGRYLNLSQYEITKLGDTKLKQLFVRTWPGRNVQHFDSRMIDGKAVRKCWNVKLPKGKLSDMNGKIKPEVREALLIKPSRVAKLVGTAPFAVGSGPPKVTYPDKRWYQFLTERPEYAESWDPVECERASVSGVWETQHRDVQSLCDPIEHSMTYESLLAGLKARGDLISLPVCKAINCDSPMYVETNPKAQTGSVSSRLYGKTHETADKFMKPIACSILRVLKHKLVFDTSLWSLGGRARRQKINEDAPLRGRIVAMPDGVPKIIGLTIASLIYAGLKVLNYGNPFNECQICRTDFHGNFYSHTDRFESGGVRTIEADASKFDASTCEETMVVAFGILRSCFPDSDFIDHVFLYIMSGTITKNLVIPGRFIYRLTKGVPTGSPFTSILDTLVNFLAWSDYLTKYHPRHARRAFCVFFGDDTLVNIPDDMGFDIDQFEQRFAKYTGYSLSPCEIKSFHSPNWEKRPSFLKTIPCNGLPARLITDAMISASIVRRRNNTRCAYRDMVTGLAFAAPFNFHALDYIFDYREWLLRLRPTSGDGIDWHGSLPVSRKDRRDSFSYSKISENYLVPLNPIYELTKDVDLGNKPKQMNTLKHQLASHVPCWLTTSTWYTVHVPNVFTRRTSSLP
uniref:RdRp n=1 Tax=viral metagenome TaxID=1070528 RepID=A0A2V0RB80_9ZZZZ